MNDLNLLKQLRYNILNSDSANFYFILIRQNMKIFAKKIKIFIIRTDGNF